jgi:hypothetical protein
MWMRSSSGRVRGGGLELECFAPVRLAQEKRRAGFHHTPALAQEVGLDDDGPPPELPGKLDQNGDGLAAAGLGGATHDLDRPLQRAAERGKDHLADCAAVRAGAERLLGDRIQQPRDRLEHDILARARADVEKDDDGRGDLPAAPTPHRETVHSEGVTRSFATWLLFWS